MDKEKLRAHDLKQETLGFPCECWSEGYIQSDGVKRPGYSIDVLPQSKLKTCLT